jgi:hypothetical protein
VYHGVTAVTSTVMFVVDQRLTGRSASRGKIHVMGPMRESMIRPIILICTALFVVPAAPVPELDTVSCNCSQIEACRTAEPGDSCAARSEVVGCCSCCSRSRGGHCSCRRTAEATDIWILQLRDLATLCDSKSLQPLLPHSRLVLGLPPISRGPYLPVATPPPWS